MVRTHEQVKVHHHHHRDRSAEEDWSQPTEHGAETADLMHDLDALLDEIDTALEENAEGL